MLKIARSSAVLTTLALVCACAATLPDINLAHLSEKHRYREFEQQLYKHCGFTIGYRITDENKLTLCLPLPKQADGMCGRDWLVRQLALFGGDGKIGPTEILRDADHPDNPAAQYVCLAKQNSTR